MKYKKIMNKDQRITCPDCSGLIILGNAGKRIVNTEQDMINIKMKDK